MKKLATFFAACAVCSALSAQTLNIVSGNVTYAVPAAQAGEMVYADGQTITVLGKTLNMSEITKMYVDDSTVTDNSVNVTYSGSEAHVVIAGNIMQYVTPSVSGAYVSLTQEATVGDTTCGEISYSLSGESTDGQFTLTGSYKATVNLYGLNLTCATGAPLNIQNGKRIELSVKSGTVNTLKDCASGSQKGCLVCTGHLELKGNGELNITGLTGHALYAKEYITMKNCTINILGAVKDGVNCNQYFTLASGTLNISGIGDDAMQVSFKDDVDREAEDTGTITINGGTITAAVTATAAKGLKADGNVVITDGNITITTSGGGEWDTTDLKTKASTCISADGYIQVDGGTFDLTSTGSGGKGFSCDGEFIYNGGTTTISTSGGIFAYVNGTIYDNYTGNTDNLDSDYKSSAKGIKADGNVTINGGNITVTTTGNGAEGIESKAILTINDGTIVANTRDDAINSSSHMYIKGGDVTVVATNNDGLDANGNLYIEGGVVRAFGAGAPECGLDANEEENYHVFFTGGMVLAAGGGNSVPNSSASTQPYVTGSATLTAGSTVTLSSNGTTLATFTVPSNYTSSGSSTGGGGKPGRPGGGTSGGSSVLVTCPGLTAGSSYTLTCGSTTSTVTATQYGSGGMRP
ncbi:MAG: carbohydrate-binding domain-containing protein [Muribaculaceae bacterium]